jgi:hypothetical protein
MGAATFFFYDAVGALIWVGLCAGVGVLFSNQLEQLALLFDQTGGWLLTIIGVVWRDSSGTSSTIGRSSCEISGWRRLPWMN